MADGSQNGAVPKRKLIEVALPLEMINRASAREKSIRHGHPSTLHVWWSRKPLATARAVLFAQLVDDPSSDPVSFPSEEAQRAERERLHGIIERLVVWENTQNQALLDEAHREILKSTGSNPPPILDPFAGGGSIPLEAQRLGLEAHASDLNPVSVLVTKALIEIPPIFAGTAPVCPGVGPGRMDWPGASGLAADVTAYGEWIRSEVARRVGRYYPEATLEGGRKAPVIAWLWARAATCNNPDCGADVPLLSSLELSRRPGRERWLRPVVAGGRVDFEIAVGKPDCDPNKRGQGANFVCWVCGAPLRPNEVHAQLDVPSKPPARLLAVVVDGQRQRVYLPPNRAHLDAVASVARAAAGLRADELVLSAETRGTFGGNAQGRRYGFFMFSDYFSDRQLVALTTLSTLVGEARERVLTDALAAGWEAGDRLSEGGDGARAYADAVATYLALAVSRTVDRQSALCSWDASRELIRNVFARQAISMNWDIAEAMPLSDSAGGFPGQLEWVAEAVEAVPAHPTACVTQSDAMNLDGEVGVVSTDPPYYDNIGYSDLSDFFYVWLRRSLREVFPDLFGTMLVPKASELVANAYRHGGKDAAREFFEDGFRKVFLGARAWARDDFPITVYYAFKQAESSEDGKSSTGWETLLEGMIRSGWAISATWPMRSELSNRMVGQGTNALASSIVLALRPRPDDASTTDRRGLIQALRDELPDALRRLQQGNVSPVDLPQAAIGPGMAVFSRYSRVIEDDGTPMSVRSALARINEILDQVLNEQEGDYDGATRFAIAWYRQHGYRQGEFGVADNLSRARNTSVDAVRREGIITSAAGKVKLVAPSELAEDYDVLTDDRVGVWEVLHHLIARTEAGGIQAAGVFLGEVEARPEGAIDLDLVKELAFLLFHVAEGNSWTQDALAFNNVATSWPEIIEASRHAPAEQQLGMNLEA